MQPVVQALFALLTTSTSPLQAQQSTPAPAFDEASRREAARASTSQLWLDRSIRPERRFVSDFIAGSSSGIRVAARRGTRRRGLEARARVTLTRVVFELRF